MAVSAAANQSIGHNYYTPYGTDSRTNVPLETKQESAGPKVKNIFPFTTLFVAFPKGMSLRGTKMGNKES
jgi:hypothetical protein